jgi:TMEM175 potassium channel family protein
MSKGRLEAFSDGVIAIIITIMVLELHPPDDPSFEKLVGMLPHFLAYVLSFVFLGIYWNNHHHMLQATTHVTGGVLWANLHLLFWLSLVPFVTAWMAEHHDRPLPVAVYGTVLLLDAIAYTILERTIVGAHGPDSPVGRALGNDVKGLVSLAAYTASIPLAYVHPWYSYALFVFVALLWLVPDRRIEKTLHQSKAEPRASGVTER